MIAAVTHFTYRSKRKERVAVDHGAHNPMIEPPSFLQLIHRLRNSHVLAFLSLRDVAYFDTALANHLLRNRFHRFLNGVVLRGPANYQSVRWFQDRGCFMDRLVVTSQMKNIANIHAINRISELHLRGAADISVSDMIYLFTNCNNLVKFSVGCLTDLHGHRFDTISKPLPLLTLQISNNHHLQDDTVIALLTKCPHLQALHANDCAKLTPDVVRAVAKNCPELQEIHFNWSQTKFEKGKRMKDVDFVSDSNSCYCELFRACTQLKIVDFYSRKDYSRLEGNISPVDVLALAQHCSQLILVRLCGADYLYSQQDDSDLLDSAVVQLVQNNPFIESLTLKNFQRVTKVALDAIAVHLTQLHTLSIRSCGSLLEQDSHNMRMSCKKLTTLETGCKADLLVLEGLPNALHTLRIHSDQYVTDEVLGRIAQYHSKLQAFNLPLYSACLITNTGLCVALSCWHNLRTFIATGDYGYDFARKALNPENVVVKAPVVDDSVLYALVQNCPLLTTLDVSGNTELSNEALCEIAKLVHVKNFTANGCWLMEDSALAAITLACIDLTHIELSDCRITDVGVRTMAIYGAHKLRHVSLTDCMYLNNSCIQQLIRASRKLQLLRIRNNSNVSFAAVSELPSFCPYMEVLCIGWMRYSLYWAYRKHKYYFDSILPKL